jgi:hypothetical protein
MGEKQLEIPDKTRNNTFNIDKKFDYSTVRGMVIQSLEKSVREELNRHMGSVNLHKIDIQGDEDVIVTNTNNLFDDQDDTAELSQTSSNYFFGSLLDGCLNKNRLSILSYTIRSSFSLAMSIRKEIITISICWQ